MAAFTPRRTRTECLTHYPGEDKCVLMTIFEETCHHAEPEQVVKYMNETAEALILTDSDGKILDVNEPWVELCGFTAEDVVGKTSNILQGPETEPTVKAEINSATKQGKAIDCLVTNYKKCGTIFKNKVTILPIATSPSGTPKTNRHKRRRRLLYPDLPQIAETSAGSPAFVARLVSI